jgi:hypothetical protein
LWLSDINKAVSHSKGADSRTDSYGDASSGSVCDGPCKPDYLITANEDFVWICGESIYLGSRASGDRYGYESFDIAGSVGADGSKSISGGCIRRYG